MSKSKHTAQMKIEIVNKYLLGEGSYARLAEAHRIGEKALKEWVHRYREQGEAGFWCGTGNNHYSKAFKMKCVEAFLRGDGSVDYIVAKNNIPSSYTLRSWIKCYNANMELKDYEPKGEVYMADARRKTTLEERREIVDYCIRRNNNYKRTASKY